MHHVAIMKKSWNLIPKIASGEKSIESRWYQTRRTPWNSVTAGDTVFFKDTGKPVTAKAVVMEVFQLEIASKKDILLILKKYGKEICLVDPNPDNWDVIPRYCILMRLTDPVFINPFEIDKKGFGAGVAWITVKDIAKIKR